MESSILYAFLSYKIFFTVFIIPLCSYVCVMKAVGMRKGSSSEISCFVSRMY